ncbi:MAG TPA: T3SS effector HopA1 family protein [Thermoanaerobaculia bacterium]|nr:T3SS effector HopA1 family protein [Thermoanaerobaculia bacterium]
MRELLRAIVIHSPAEYSLAGEIIRVAPFHFANAEPPLVADLRMRLYDRAYCRELGTPAIKAHVVDNMTDVLSAANATRERWDRGWITSHIDARGRLVAHKRGLTHIAPPGRFTNDGAVLLEREQRDAQPGFYIALGEEPVDHAQTEIRMTRMYFHVTAASAPALLHALTSSLNRYKVPFTFKTLSNANAYTRADAAVLFFAKRYFPIIADLIPRNLELRPRTPLFTKRLHDGIAIAEDPGAGQSFGESRCRLVAQAVWDTWTRSANDEDAKLRELELQFDRAGLSLERPWLRARSVDVYVAQTLLSVP